MKGFVIGTIIASILFVGLGWLLVGQTPETEVAQIEVVETDNITGNASASATLIEFSDLQCPACKNYLPFVYQLKEELGDQIRIVFKHFPLNIHQNAEKASVAAQAAANQGKFWEMHDQLFATQESWATLDNPDEVFAQYAVELELDPEAFAVDYADPATLEIVRDDYQEGLRAGVNSTPSFFINGTKITNPGSYEAFKSLIEQNL